jgi:hypothetical protein
MQCQAAYGFDGPKVITQTIGKGHSWRQYDLTREQSKDQLEANCIILVAKREWPD